MSRYLTPGKIALLCITSLYADSAVPTVAVIPVLSSIISYVLSANGCQLGREGSRGQLTATLSIEELQRSTIGYASGIPGRTLWDLLLKKLWEIHSFDALMVFFDSLETLIQPADLPLGGRNTADVQRIKFSRTSPFGTFIRRAQLEFTRLQFDDGVALWKSFVTYRFSTLSMWRRRNPGAGKACFDINLTDELLGKSEKLFAMSYGDLEAIYQQNPMVSGDDVEKFLERQKDQMQSKAPHEPRVKPGTNSSDQLWVPG
jgi:anaphase-promoting complex subunit 5